MTVEKIYKNELQVPISIHNNLCQNYDVETGGQLKVFASNRDVKIDDSFSKTFEQLSDKYQKHKLNRLVGKTALEINSAIIKGAFEFVSVPAKATGVGFVLTKGIQKGMDILLDQTMELYDSQSRQEAEKIIGKHLQILRDNEGIRFEEVSGLTQEQAFKKLFGSDKGIFDNSISHIEDQDKPNMIFHMTKLMETRFTNALALNELADQAQSQDIGELKVSVNKLQTLSRTLVSFQVETKNQVDRIESNLTSIKNNMDELREDININTEDISILKDFMFNSLDVGEQIKAIEAGMRGDPNLPENSKLKLQLEAFKAKQDLSKNISDYVNGAQTIMNIANNIGDELGVDPEFLKKANDLVNTASTVANAYLAFSSGNALGAISQVSGLFGSKKDPAAERHKEIINRLKVIDKKLDHVLDNQKSIIENQHKIIKLQLDTIKVLGKLANDLDIKHEKIMQKLEFIHRDVIYNRQILMNLAFKDLNNLEAFVKYFRNYQLENRKIVNYKDRREHFHTYGPLFVNAQEDLINELNSDKINSYLKLESYTTQGEYKKLNNNLLSFNSFISFIENYAKDKIHLIVNSSLMSVEKISDLNQKKSLPVSNDLSNYNWESIKSLISINHLEVISSLLLQTHEYFILHKTNKSLFKIEELYNEEFLNISGINLLKELEKIINIAIIQENILSGDVMLELAYDSLYETFEEDPSSSQKYDALIELLKNELFKRNFTKYLIHKELRRTNTNMLQYSVALANIDATNQPLRNMFDHSKLSVGLEYITKNEKYRTSGWYINLPKDKTGDSLWLKLEDYIEFDNGKLSYRYEMEKLHSLKGELIDVLLDYENNEILRDDSELISHLLSY
jgi:hypothetical protein